MSDCFLLISVSGIQRSKGERSISASWAKTEFLQMVLSIFLNDNSYSIIKSDILKDSPKKENLVNSFSSLYPKDNLALHCLSGSHKC